MIEPMIYHGEFWIPSDNLSERRVINTGTLQIIKGEKAVLAIHKFKFDAPLFDFSPIKVIWGLIADEFPVTLFDVRFQQSKGTSFVSFTVKLTLFGQHVFSMDTPFFNKCIVKYPYLKTWVCTPRIQLKSDSSKDILVVDTTNLSTPLVTAVIEQGLQIEIRESVPKKYFPPSFYWEIYQEAKCVFVSDNELSVNHFQQLITEFTQFLSIALYCKQFPLEILLFDEKDNQVELVFPQKESKEPRWSQLIQFPELQSKVPLMLVNWHKQYSQIAPICRFLLQSLNNNLFDSPDFLIVVNALEGFHKRFISCEKIDFKSRMNDLISNHFKNVDLIQKCGIDTEALKQSRNYYTHLYNKTEKTLTGQDLYILSQKCKVLLTCCILDLLGLSIEEINMCCQKSNIHFMVDIV